MNQTNDIVKYNIPTHCELCGQPLTITDTRVYCNNPHCKGVIKHKVAKYLQVLDVKGFGEAMQEWVIEYGDIQSIQDLYNMEEKAINAYYSKVNARKAYNDLKEKSKNITLAKLIAGMDIEGIGEEIAKVVTDKYKTLDEIKNLTENDLINLEGFSEIRAKQFVNGFKENEKDLFMLVEDKYVALKENKSIEVTETCSLTGKKICVTGKLNNFSRKSIEEFMENKGIIFTDSVKKDTDYLLTNDKDSGSSKNKNAQKFGIPIINEDEFIKMVNRK